MNRANFEKVLQLEMDAGLHGEAVAMIEGNEVQLRIARVGKYQDSREYWKLNGNRIARRRLLHVISYLETHGEQ